MTVFSVQMADGFSENAYRLLKVTANDLEELIKQYNVNATTLEDMLRSVHEWYEKQPHLPQGQLHDQVLVRHLITCQFSLERVKNKLDNYYTARCKMPELLANRDPMSPQVDMYLSAGCWVILPKITPEKHRVTIFRLKEPLDIVLADAIKVSFMISEFRLWNDTIEGEQWIFDFKHTNLQHAMQVTPTIATKIAFYLSKCLLPKIKGLHIVNVPSYGDTVFNLCKKFLKAKLIQRIHNYNSLDEAMQKFPKSIIPRDLGGEEISCQEITDEWMKTLKSPPWRQYFIEQDKVFADESKRINRRKDDDLLGVGGSFRKLEVD